MSTLDKKLKRYSITSARYQFDVSRLLLLGYNLEQANCIIIRMSSKNTVRKLIELCDFLHNNFTHDQITQIASKFGATKCLAKIHDDFELLKKFEFTAEEITRIAKQACGTKYLETAIKLSQKNGFTHNQIVEYVANKNGTVCVDNRKKRKTQQKAHKQTMVFFVQQNTDVWSMKNQTPRTLLYHHIFNRLNIQNQKATNNMM